MAKITPTNFAANDSYAWTEDQLLSSGELNGNIVTLDVLANDAAIKPLALYSIDAGNGGAADANLLTADANGAWESTSSGDRMRIYNGAVQLDLSHSLAALGATDIQAMAGDSGDESQA